MRAKRIFTDEEKKYIQDNWEKESAHSMKIRFKCSWYSICGVANELGLKMPESNNWTEEQIETLKVLAEKYHYSEIAKIMSKSENAIYLKARKLGITLIQDRRKWTELEEDLLRELWGEKTIELIAKKLRRTVFSVKVKAVRMSLGPMVQSNGELILVSDICDMLKITDDRIRNTWVKLGLKLQKKRLTKNKSYYYVIWEDLIDFLQNNQNEWDSRNLEKNMLGVEQPWLIEKRRRDRIENPLWYRKWTDDEINKAIILFKRKYDYSQIAKELNRSEGAVANLLRSSGYSYQLPYYWSESDLQYLHDNYLNKTYEEIAADLGRTRKAVGAKAEELGYQKRLTLKNKK